MPIAMSDSLCRTRFGASDGAFTGAVWGPPPAKRGAFLLGRLLEQGGRAIRVRPLGGDRAGEIRLTRFLRNAAVSVGEMVAEAGLRTAERSCGREVLAIQDTTAIRSEGGGGDYLHVVLAVDALDGSILGLIDGQFLHRQGGRRAQRRGAAVEDKESFRWLQGADQAATVCAGADRVTVVADREGDIFEAFALRPEGAELLVRAAQDRSLAEGGRLFAALDALPEAARAELDLPAGPGRTARTTQVALRFATTTLARPKGGERTGLAASVTVQVVDVREPAPPCGLAPVHWTPVHWRLLTTRPVRSAAEAWSVAETYRKRWAIEQLFRTLKTKGFDVEGLQIEDPGPRDKLVTAALVAATHIQQLVHARDGGPGPLRPCADVFPPEDTPLLEAYCAKLEGKTERQKNPHPKGSLAYAAWVCARLGGWTGYYGKPGPAVMLDGWLELQSAKRGIALFIPGHNV